MPIITNIGTTEIFSLLCVVLLVYSIITKNRAIKYLAITGIVSLLFTSITIYVLKVIIHESRPFVTLDSVRLLVTENDPYSFPSGHSGNIFALAISFGLSWKFNIINKPVRLVWLLLPLAAIVGFSRVYVGVHYPFDVVAGAIIGIISGLIATKLINTYLIKHKTEFKNHYEGIFKRSD